MKTIEVTVNGTLQEVHVEPRLLLSDFLRHQLGLTGTHVGCEHGVCGACTVLINGKATRSCLTFAIQTDGSIVETVESLANGTELHPIQQALQNHRGLQCGFCTPGILMTMQEFVRSGIKADREQLRELLSGNLCRCTGYETILDALEELVNQNELGAQHG